MTNKTALVIIDVQLGMFKNPVLPPVHNGETLLAKLQGLIAQARAADVPVVYVQHNGGAESPLAKGSAEWKIHPDIKPADTELVVQKLTPDSFHETVLHQELSAQGIEKLIVAGIQSEYCVDTTCRRAYSQGYEVTLVSDAHSTWDREPMTAPEIIAHHNRVLGDWFVKLQATDDVQF